jgi:hypothetical protein
MRNVSLSILLASLTLDRVTAKAVAAASATVTIASLKESILQLRSGDERLFPWDVSEETAKEQEVVCPKTLFDTITILCTPFPAEATPESRRDTLELKALAATLTALCLSDHPKNRALLSSNHPQVFESVVQLIKTSEHVSSADQEDRMDISGVVSAAAHLIWASVYGNAVNHAGFEQAGAVAALSPIIVKSYSVNNPGQPLSLPPVSIMWAAAALQNLAASYCGQAVVTANGSPQEAAGGDPTDPRCHWDWVKDEATHVNELQIAPDSGSLVIDAAPVRLAMLSISNLVENLLEWSCTGPVHGEPTDENPFVGESAQYGTTDEHHENLLPWAAAGAIKNLALEPAARPIIDAELSCFCWLLQSPDWLEANKGEGVVHHLRPTNPCWFQGDSEHEHDEDAEVPMVGQYLCVDTAHFVDHDQQTCEDFTSPEDCEHAVDVATGIKAAEACCSCGGGRIDTTSESARRAAEMDEFDEEL